MEAAEGLSEGGSAVKDRRSSHVAPEVNRTVAKVTTDRTRFRLGGLDTVPSCLPESDFVDPCKADVPTHRIRRFVYSQEELGALCSDGPPVAGGGL